MSQKVHVFNETPNWPIVDVNNGPGGVNQQPATAWQFSHELVKLCPKTRYLASVMVISNFFFF